MGGQTLAVGVAHGLHATEDEAHIAFHAFEFGAAFVRQGLLRRVEHLDEVGGNTDAGDLGEKLFDRGRVRQEIGNQYKIV